MIKENCLSKYRFFDKFIRNFVVFITDYIGITRFLFLFFFKNSTRVIDYIEYNHIYNIY